MLHLDRTHDPRKNADLLAKITQNQLPIKKKILKTEQLFKQACQKPIPVVPTQVSKQPRSFSEKMMEGLFRLLSKPSTLLNPSKIMVDEERSCVSRLEGKAGSRIRSTVESYNT